MKIGELAKRTGCSVQTIRYYEKEQLLASTQRSEGNFRLFGVAAVEQMMFIKHCRSLDLTLLEIRQLLALTGSPNTQCDDVNRMIDAHIEQVEERLVELSHLRQQLKILRNSCSSARTVEQCGILHSLTTNRTPEP
ncbi:Cd(II)/Pb(II)-responsive transcriptional regulator [Thalassolituus sp.]|uniref:Cd(II)/Pb(II)-responsive transcriptional regulator n=1 Tax=Thalassolituus sp. TaxID=2030822 RepID=UPI0032D95381